MFGLAGLLTADVTGFIFASSFQSRRRFSDDAQIDVFLHVDRTLQESEVALHVDIGLQRSEVRQQIGAAGIFLAGEQPAGETFRRLLGDARGDLLARIALPAALVATILPLRSATFCTGLSLSTKNWLV